MSLDNIGREFGELGSVPDHIEGAQYVSGDGIEDLHPVLGEQMQHIQCGVTWSESKLMIENQAIGEEEGFDV